MSPASKLIKPNEGVAGISNLQLVSQKHGWQPGLVISIWISDGGGWGQSCGTNSLTCVIWCYFRIDSAKIELNYRPSSWCQRIAWWNEEPPTHILELGAELFLLWYSTWGLVKDPDQPDHPNSSVASIRLCGTSLPPWYEVAAKSNNSMDRSHTTTISPSPVLNQETIGGRGVTRRNIRMFTNKSYGGYS